MAEETSRTRDRLLEAASALFAAKGFRAATVAGICRAARANIAAVNYHFGGKENLYREAWRYAHNRTLQMFPPDGGVPPEAPAEERLKGRIRSILQRAISDDGREFQIMSHEIANGTNLLDQVVHDTLRPLGEATEGIVRELLGGAADESTVRLCTMSVIGPCLHMLRRPRKHTNSGPWRGFGLPPLEEMAEHFATFALAGIREVRRQIDNEGPGGCGGGRKRGRA